MVSKMCSCFILPDLIFGIHGHITELKPATERLSSAPKLSIWRTAAWRVVGKCCGTMLQGFTRGSMETSEKTPETHIPSWYMNVYDIYIIIKYNTYTMVLTFKFRFGPSCCPRVRPTWRCCEQLMQAVAEEKVEPKEK